MTTRHTYGGPWFGRLIDGCPRCEEQMIEVIAPAYWASYLFNGDESLWDYDPEDKAECKRLEAQYGSPVDMEEVGFYRHPDYGKAGDCAKYVFLAK